MKNLTLMLHVSELLVLALIVLLPLFILAKDEQKAAKEDKKAEKAERRIERSGSRLVEKIKDNKKSVGTNVVWKTGREFPTMFQLKTKNPK